MLALFIVVAILFGSIPVVSSSQDKHFTESIDVYVAGSHALWSITFTGINVSNSIKALEKVNGINSYNITAVNTSNWFSDFQLFGPEGYNTIGIPFVPSSGVFLSINALDRNASDKLATYVGEYLYTDFILLSSSGNSFLYFAPISFNEIIPATLLKLIPYSYGGFSSLVDVSLFKTQSSPMVQLSATNFDGSYIYSLKLSSISNSVLSTSGSLNLLSTIGTTKKFVEKSNLSYSSTIKVSVLDGLISSKDNATVSNNISKMRGYYLLTLADKEKIYNVNVTVTQGEPSLIAKRVVDSGSPAANKLISVTVSFTNISNKTIYNVSLADRWYTDYPFFKLKSGNPDIKIDNITSGQTVSRTYVLNYTGGNSRIITIPPIIVSYEYKAGSLAINGSTYVNGLSLSPGINGPALYAYVTAGTSSISAGGSTRATIYVFNVGSSPALNVSVAGKTVQTIQQAGGSWTVNVKINSSSLTDLFIEKQYNITYNTPEGKKESIVTNSLLISVDHNGLKFPFGFVTYEGTITQLGKSLNLTLTFTVSNRGLANMSSFSLKGKIPEQIGCGKVIGKNITCNDNTISLGYRLIKPGQTEKSSITYIINSSGNILLPPLNYTFSGGNKMFKGTTNMLGFPTGIKVEKIVSPEMLFRGMKTNMTVSVSNSGPGKYSNITVRTTQESFGKVISNLTSITNRTLAAGKELFFSYAVSVTQSGKGNRTLSPVSVSMFFAGTKFTFSFQTGSVSLLPSPFATVTSSVKQPVEEREFNLLINITNPSSVAISNIRFSFVLPREVRVLSTSGAIFGNGNITVVIPSLPAGQSKTLNISVISSSSSAIDFSNAAFTFIYSNQVLRGSIATGGIVITENIVSRYLLPSFLALIAILAVSFYMRYRLVRKN
jgi:hypothetical protein